MVNVVSTSSVRLTRASSGAVMLSESSKMLRPASTTSNDSSCLLTCSPTSISLTACQSVASSFSNEAAITVLTPFLTIA